jgi:16S rRNA (guanine527-N7)-methyltransferase
MGPAPEAAAEAGTSAADAMPTADVSGEISDVSPVPPAVAHDIFGTCLPAAERYAGMLAGIAVERGLIGPHEAGRLWERHLLNCAVVADLIPPSGSLIDIGSGAGLPGIVLAMLRPDLQVTLLEPMARRVVFLDECVASLGLENVTVHRGRAEDVAGQLMADVATARAVAPLDRLAAPALALVRPGGTVLALKGERAADEAKAAAPLLRKLGVREVTVLQAGAGKISPATTVIRLVAGPRPGSRTASGPRVAGRSGRRSKGRERS